MRFQLNDTERELWIENDEGIYYWWMASQESKRKFIRTNRTKLDEIILKRAQGN